MGATMPMPMADDILEPIRQRQREQEPFNPFTAKPPSTPPPMREERGPPICSARRYVPWPNALS